MKNFFNVRAISPDVRKAILMGIVSFSSLMTGCAAVPSPAYAQGAPQTRVQEHKPWADNPAYIAQRRQIDTYAAHAIPQANATFAYQMQTCSTYRTQEQAANSTYNSPQQGGGVLGDINRAMDKFNRKYGQPNANYNYCIANAKNARDYVHNGIAQQYENLDAQYAQAWQQQQTYNQQVQQQQAAQGNQHDNYLLQICRQKDAQAVASGVPMKNDDPCFTRGIIPRPR